ncbi:MAG: TetR family transcriptional regulator [Acidimicrobiales bacterium]|nr:TetR family transcriptional regulator [Acidimicrobiales bacterium]
MSAARRRPGPPPTTGTAPARADASSASRPPVTRDAVVHTAMGLVEDHGIDALTMRRLSDELGVAVTAIYWHVGNRDALLDALVDRLVVDMGTLRPSGATARERITSLAESLRARLRDRPHLIGLAHDRGRTPAMFLPVEQVMAAELATVGVRGKDAALALRAISTHVVGSVLLERAADRSPAAVNAGDLWPPDADDPELVEALAAPTDFDRLFAVALNALVDALVPREPTAD